MKSHKAFQVSRRGYTVVELIVTLSIIGLLISLLAPALQSARESARKSACRNNLRQLALAVHQYESVYRSLPMAVIPSRARTWNVEGLRFNAQLLPFLEQASIAAALKTRDTRSLLTSFYAQYGTLIPEGLVVLPIMRCPSSTMSLHAIDSAATGGGKLPAAVRGYANADYVAVAGPSGAFGMFPLLNNFTTPVRSMADVTDGLSNTLAIGEHSYPGRSGTQFPIWIAAYGFPHDSNFIDTHFRINCVDSFSGQFWATAQGNACALSLHPGISQFAFGDGAVRSLSENIDQRVYTLLGAIADGEPVLLDF